MVVSAEVHRNTYQATLSYDYATGRISQKPIAVSYLEQFFATCTATLVIEGLILLLFGFSLKQNWRVFLLVNLATQVFLTFTTGTVLFRYGALAGYLVFIPVEGIILAAEVIAFAKLLNQHSKKRRVGYAVTANLLSFAAGWALIWLAYILHAY